MEITKGGAALTRPQATIVITTRDRPEFLDRAVESALRQSVQDVEIIVIDDGSTLPATLRSVDPRLRCVRQEVSVGLSGARNIGLQLARAPWITFLDDDDRLLPHMLETSLRAVEGSSLPPPIAVVSGVEVVDKSGHVLETSRPSPIPRGDNYLHQRKYKYNCNLLAPVEVLRSIGGWDSTIVAWEHDDLLVRLNAECSIEGISQTTYLATAHSGPRLTTNFLACADGINRTLAKYPQQFASSPRLHARYLAEMSKNYLKAGMWLPAVGGATRSLIRNPRRRHALRQWVGSLLGPRVKSFYLRNRERRNELGRQPQRGGTVP